MHILLGILIGLLCGIIPLIFGLLIKSKIIGIIGTVASSLSGGLFAAFDKSPFTAIGISIVFVVILFAGNKKKNTHHEEEDHDIYMDDE